MNLQDFKTAIIKLGCKELSQETTDYGDLDVTNQLYAIKGGKLIGCYSDKAGGKVFSKTSTHFSTSGRTFRKIKIA